jgi:hypothetical protein
MLMAVDNRAAQIGASDEVRDLWRLDATTQFHETQIRSIAEQEPDRARAMLDAAVKAKEIHPQEALALQRTVTHAAVNTQSQQLARFLDVRGGATLQEKLETAAQLHEKGEISTEVLDGTAARLRTMDDTRDRERAQAANKALVEAQEFATLNRTTVKSYEELPAATKTALESTGSANKMRLFYENGGQWITTERGLKLLMGATPERLLRYKSKEQLFEAFREHLNDPNLLHLGEEWDRAWGMQAAAGKKDDLTEGDIGAEIRQALADAGQLDIATGVRDGNERETKVERDRWERMELAIKKSAKAAGGENWKDPKIIKQAIETELGKEIRDAAGNKRVLGSMTQAEMQGAYWETPSGQRIEAAAIDDTTMRMSAVAALDKRGVAVTPQAIAEELGRQRQNMKDTITATVQKHRIRSNPLSALGLDVGYGFSRQRYRMARTEAEATIAAELAAKGITLTPAEIRELLR